jgi:hypothetical protein
VVVVGDLSGEAAEIEVIGDVVFFYFAKEFVAFEGAKPGDP